MDEDINFKFSTTAEYLELAIGTASGFCPALKIPRRCAQKLGLQLMTIGSDHRADPAQSLLAMQSAIEIQQPHLEVGVDDQGRVAIAISMNNLAPIHVLLTDEQANSLADGIKAVLGSKRTKAGTRPN